MEVFMKKTNRKILFVALGSIAAIISFDTQAGLFSPAWWETKVHLPTKNALYHNLNDHQVWAGKIFLPYGQSTNLLISPFGWLGLLFSGPITHTSHSYSEDGKTVIVNKFYEKPEHEHIFASLSELMQKMQQTLPNAREFAWYNPLSWYKSGYDVTYTYQEPGFLHPIKWLLGKKHLEEVNINV